MSETPRIPEEVPHRFLLADTLTDVQGTIDRIVLEDDGRTDMPSAILSTHSKVTDGIEEILSIRWNKDEAEGVDNRVHAVITLLVGPAGEAGSKETYTIGTNPELCWNEFQLGSDTHRMPLDEISAKELITLLRSFLSGGN